MAELTIRPATMRDYEAICRLAAQADRIHAELLPEVFQEFAGPARPREAIAAYVEAPDADYLLAEASGEVVGFLNLRRAANPDYPMFRTRQFAMIENLVVDEAQWRRGVATALLAAAREWVLQRGLDSLQLTVWAANAAALALYEKQGFGPLTLRLEWRTAETAS